MGDLRLTQQKVAYAPPHEVRLKAAPLEAPHHLRRIRIDPVVVEDDIVPGQPGADMTLKDLALAPCGGGDFGDVLDRVRREVWRRR